MAAGSTFVYDFPKMEGAVLQGLNRAGDGLLYDHRSFANRTGPRIFADGNANAIGGQSLFAEVGLEGRQMLPQRRERAEPGPPFFASS